MSNRARIAGIVAEQGLSTHPDNVCLLDGDNRITYCNPAWDRFALENGGEQATFAKVEGLNLLSVCIDELRGFYRQMLSRCRATGTPVTHGYNCSSALVLRTARMTVRPHGNFLFIQHKMLTEEKHKDIPRVFDEQYVAGGVIRMCANCRRTFNRKDSTWEWIPQLLEALPRNATHGLCEPCQTFYFGDLPDH